MKVLVAGSKGQLGVQLIKALAEKKINCFGIDQHNCDITNEEHVNRVVFAYMPDVIINCAAYTKIDDAEKEKEECFNINVNGTKNLANACLKIDATMILISTAYVFDGTKRIPYTESDKPNPVNYYGFTKHMSELEVTCLLKKYFVIRTSRLFSSNGYNFVDKVLKLSKQKSEIHVVDDQIGTPTYTVDLANTILQLLDKTDYGIYHITNEGHCSFYELAKKIYDIKKISTEVIPISSSHYHKETARPKYTVLSNEKIYSLGLEKIPDWEDALRRYLV